MPRSGAGSNSVVRANSDRRTFGANSIVAVFGSLLPALLGVLATIVVSRSGSSSNVPALLWAWTAVGFLSLTDFGLTRAGSKHVAEGSEPLVVATTLWRTSVLFGLALSVVAGVVFAVVDSSSVVWLLLPIPFVTAVQFPVIGILEAQGKYGVLARQRLFNGIFIYLLPACATVFLPTSYGLTISVSVMSAYKIGALLYLARAAGVAAAFRLQRATKFRNVTTERPRNSVLVWLALSSVLGPIFLYSDRLALSILGIDQELWVLYVSLSELLIKTYIIPTALMTVFFPWMVRNSHEYGARVRAVASVGFLVTALGAGAIVAVSIAGGADILIALLGGETTSDKTSLVVGLLLAGTAMNWFAQFQIAQLHARHQQRAVALSQVVILVLYIGALAVAVGLALPIQYIAIAWSARIALQSLIFALISVALLRGSSQ